MLLGILAAAGAASVAGAFFGSRMKRALRRVRRLRRGVQREIDKTQTVLDSRERALREEADRYIVGQIKERLRDVPIDTLRKQTGAGVKVAPLAEAGIETVGDLVGRPARDLKRIRGIGAHSAAALERAAREFVETAKRTPPPLPRADLEEPGAQELARDALVYLDAWRELRDEPGRMRAALEPIDSRIAEQPTAFLDWIARRTEPERLDAIADELKTLDTGAEARGRVSSRMPKDIRAEFRDNYADCCAVLDGVFGEVGAAKREQVAGAAPAQREIAKRVEEHPLDTQGLGVILRRYQAFGARYLLALERTVLGDEMGLGKTIQALAAKVHLHNTQGGGRFLVVAPASILGNWMHEIAARTDLDAHLLHGGDFDESLRAWQEGGGVGVTSYSTLRRNIAAVAPSGIDMLIADEAHYVKNPEARRTQALRRVAAEVDRVCFMSGTPLENHPEEFVHLLDSLAPRRARDLGAFLKQPGSVLGGARQFHEELADVYLRRNQEDVLKELPDRIDKQEWVDLGADEMSAYASMVHAGNFMGMRRVVTRDAKLERLADLVTEYKETGTKVLLFSYFLDVLKEVAERFETCGAITGSVAPQDRFALVQQFNEAEGHALLCGQIQAAGTGLNLQAAGAVVLMEPQLKPTTEAQAVARAHRMGQTRRVVVHRLLARDCVDERLVDILGEKQDLFDRFARESLIKEASEEATASAILQAERERLG